ncbi:MAG: CcmD family protein [Herpetosiphonaceae bacterium]|nr:CcmD family protein [Herpetosiphonaceae bacterium]
MDGLIEPGLALYVSAAVAVVVWLGIFAYLWRIDAQAKALRRMLDEQRSQAAPQAAPTPQRPERVKETRNV